MNKFLNYINDNYCLISQKRGKRKKWYMQKSNLRSCKMYPLCHVMLTKFSQIGFTRIYYINNKNECRAINIMSTSDIKL